MTSRSVFVVRWSTTINEAYDCGNFEVCYGDEKSASAAMMKDAKDSFSALSVIRGMSKPEFNTSANDDGVEDYCAVEVKNGDDPGDVYEWWIDKLELVEA